MTPASAHAIQVAGICGSLRQGSFTSMALQVALAGAQEAGAQTRLAVAVDLQKARVAAHGSYGVLCTPLK